MLGSRTRLFLALGLVACAARRGPSAEEVFTERLADHDAAWAERGRYGLDAPAGFLESIPARYRQHPEVRWRWARVHVARALVSDGRREGQRWLVAARDEAMTCVREDVEIAAVGEAEGLRESLAALEARRARCAAWAGLSWSWWLTTWPVAAMAEDHAVVAVLLDRADALGEVAMARHGAALLAARTSRSQGGGPEVAESGLEVARRTVSDVDARWLLWADQAVLARASGRVVPPEPSAPPTTPEARAARRGGRDEGWWPGRERGPGTSRAGASAPGR